MLTVLQTLFGHFFLKTETEIINSKNCGATKKLKEKNNTEQLKLDKITSQSFRKCGSDGLYVSQSAFVGGIKKKLSPTLAFETQIYMHFDFAQKILSKLFILI